MRRIVLLAALLLTTSPAWAMIPEECRGMKEAMPYAKCIIAWENTHLRASYPFPDLLDRLHRARLDIAARLESGELAKGQGNAELKRVEQEVLLEGRRRIDRQYGVTERLLENPAVFSRRPTDCLGVDFGGGISTLSCN